MARRIYAVLLLAHRSLQASGGRVVKGIGAARCRAFPVRRPATAFYMEMMQLGRANGAAVRVIRDRYRAARSRSGDESGSKVGTARGPACASSRRCGRQPAVATATAKSVSAMTRRKLTTGTNHEP
jgi:hypothetical protein